jgi:protein tyrosine/serine phosphatase
MWRIIHGLIVASYITALVGVPYIYAKEQRARSRNFRVVTPEVLYRCGQLNEAGLERIVFDYGIRTVVSLRSHDGVEHASLWEEDYCLNEGLVFARLPLANWRAGERGEFPLAEKAEEFMRIMADPKKYPRPILLHCFAGMHRTGALVAVYRMEYEGWTNDEAIAELAECGYPDLEDDISGFLRNYQPRAGRP